MSVLNAKLRGGFSIVVVVSIYCLFILLHCLILLFKNWKDALIVVVAEPTGWGSSMSEPKKITRKTNTAKVSSTAAIMG